MFLSVWIDDISGFGTFPIESMKSGVPVIGKIPNLFPQWMNEDNGIWIQNQNQIVDFVADFIKNWLEDNINTTIYEGIEKTANEYSSKEKYENKVVRLFDSYFSTRMISFMEQLNKLETPVTEDGK